MAILVLNAGSSGLKFSLFDDQAAELLASGAVEKNPAAFEQVRRETAKRLPDAVVRSVGHRVVHGGTRFRESVLIDGDVLGALKALSSLAPLHNPPAVEILEAAQRAFPDAVHTAVFDTTFFADLPLERIIYPLPYAWYEVWGIRRFGFHGLSHAYAAQRAAEMAGRSLPPLRVVTCHLGNGCSAAAVQGGRAVATTMGFTPLEGLMMGTRSGSVDPGILVHVQERYGLTAEEVDRALNQASGLLGVSGVSADIRSVQAAALEGHARARLALSIYADRVRSAVGALAVTLGGVDALVFTGGVGENMAEIRRQIVDGLECLGLGVDPALNASARPDADVSAAEAAGRVFVVRSREDVVIARETRRLADPVPAK
jgi:acetate kinase